MVLKKTNKLIGLIGFCGWNPGSGSADLMVLEARKYWHMGYMAEALREVLLYGFLHMGLNRIDSYVHPDNEKALKFHEKFGFSKVGIIPERSYYRGAYCDRVLFIMLKEEFLINKVKGTFAGQ